MSTRAEAIERARAEAQQSRAELDRATGALLDVLSTDEPTSVAAVLNAVSGPSDMPVATVQRALWALVQAGRVVLSESFQPRLRDRGTDNGDR